MDTRATHVGARRLMSFQKEIVDDKVISEEDRKSWIILPRHFWLAQLHNVDGE